MASITVSSEGVDQKYPLDQPSVTIGRGLESDIRLKDIKSSRRHCQIVKGPKGYQLVDLSSGNGTFINGAQLNKQQALASGDKIQIGTTVITFEDGNGAANAPAAAAPKAKTGATGVIPKAGAPAPAAAKTQGVKVATSQIPIAQTRRITTRMDAVKPSTQGIPKAGSTGAMKKTTQRAPTGNTTRSQQVSATQKFKAEARKKKVNPVALLLGAIGGVFLVVVTLIILWPKDNSELIKSQIEGYTKKAAELESQDKFDAAIAEFKKALDIAASQGDRYKSAAAEMRGRIKQLEETKALMAGANQKWQDFKNRADKATDADAGDLLQEGKRMKADYAQAPVPWLADLGKQVEILQKMVDTKAAIEKRQGFQARRQEIVEKYKLNAKDGSAQYSAAIKEWKDFLSGPSASEEKTKAQGELNTINVRAKEAVTSLRTRTNNLKDGGKKDEALEMARKERSRFELTDSKGDLDKIIADLEK